MIEFLSMTFSNIFSMAAEEQTIPLRNLGITNIIGYNEDEGGSCGAGKSSIACDILTTVLFGKNNRDQSGDELINEANLDLGCFAQVDFKVDSRLFRIMLSVKHKEYGTDHILYEYIDGKFTDKHLRGERSTDTRKKVEEILNLSYNQFVAISMLQQRRATTFIEGGNKEKMDVISAMIDVDYEKQEKIAKAKVDEFEKIIEDLKSKTEVYESQKKQEISQLLSKDIETNICLNINNLNKKIKECKRSQEKLNKIIVETNISLEKNNSEKTLLQVKFDNANDNLDNLDKEKQNEKENHTKDIENIKEELDEIKKNIEKQKEYESQILENKREFEKQKIKYDEEITEKKKSLELIKSKYDKELKKEENWHKEVSKLKEIINETRLKLRDHADKQEKLDESDKIESLLNNTKVELADFEKKFTEEEKKYVILDEIKEKIKLLEQDITKSKMEKEQLEQDVENIKNNKEAECSHCFQKVTEKHLKQVLKNKQKELAEIIEKLNNDKECLVRMNEEMEKVIDQELMDTYKTKIIEKQTLIKSYEDKKKEFDHDYDADQIEDEYDFILNEFEIKTNKYPKLRTALTSQNPITDADIGTKDFNTEEYKKELDEIELVVKNLLNDFEKIEKKYNNELITFEASLKHLKVEGKYTQEDIETREKKYIEKIEKIEAKIKKFEEEKKEIETRANEIAEQIEKSKHTLADCDHNIKQLIEQINSEIERLKEHEKSIEKNDERKLRIEEFKKLIENNKNVIAETELNRKKYNFWQVAFSDKGIKSYKFGAILGELNKGLVNASKILTDGRTLVWFDNKRELKNSGSKREIVMHVQDSYKKKTKPKGYSGGEQQIISLMVILALWQVTAVILGKSTNLLSLDEIFASLDELRRRRVVKMIESMNHEQLTILFITHIIDEVNSNHKIIVTRKNGNTLVQII
jgi:DNA repair exonuclease SbcCD ATPase subunit